MGLGETAGAVFYLSDLTLNSQPNSCPSMYLSPHMRFSLACGVLGKGRWTAILVIKRVEFGHSEQASQPLWLVAEASWESWESEWAALSICLAGCHLFSRGS